MKRNLVIMRFGARGPTSTEVNLITKTIVSPEDRHLAFGGVTIFGTISIVRTVYSPKEVARLFEEKAAEVGDKLPVVVLDLDDDNVGVHLCDMPGFIDMVRDYQAALLESGGDAEPKISIKMTLDDLLDLVNRKGGVENLTAEERKLLEKLSKES